MDNDTPVAEGLPPDDKPASEWTRAELLCFMRENAPEGVRAEALVPVVQRMIADGADPRQLVRTMRGVIAAGGDPTQMLAMSSLGALPVADAQHSADAHRGANAVQRPSSDAVTGSRGDSSAGSAGSGDSADGAGRKRARWGSAQAKKAGIIAFWLIAWELLDHIVDNRLILAGPIRTAQALADQAFKPDFWLICGASFGRIALGFLLSFAAGILLALLAHRFRVFRAFVDPIISLLRTIPVVTFIILLLIWLGNQWLTVFLAFFIVLPIIYTNMIAGFESVDAQMLEMARVYGLSRWRTLMYIYRPAVMPFLISACKLSLGMSWKSGIMAEVLATPKPSIGKEMAQARTFLDTPDVFAWTVVIMVLSWLFEKLVLWLLKRAARPAGGFLGGGARNASVRSIEAEAAPLKIAGLNKAFGDNVVLRNLGMRLSAGGVYCLSAPSGSGKTTLFRVLLGLETADSGAMSGWRASQTSMMFQEDRLCEELTPVENVLLVLPKDACREDARVFLAEILPARCLDHPAVELSGGMRRRVSLARAMAFSGSAIVLDEPFTGLDVDTRRKAIDFILKHCAGRTLLVATHGLEDAELLGAKRLSLDALQEASSGDEGPDPLHGAGDDDA